MAFKDTIRKCWSPVVWGNLLAMLIVCILLLIGVKIFLSSYTLHGQEIEVPDVTGAMAADAETILEGKDLIALVSDTAYDKSMPLGAILKQIPVGGSKVKAGRRILLTINSASANTTTVPDIADNCSVREAQDRLRVLGFPTVIEEVEGDKDWVYAVKWDGRYVYAGEKIDAGVTLTLQVGRGRYEAPDSITDYNEGNGNLFDAIDNALNDIFNYD